MKDTGLLAGRYRLERRLGQGGMGSVWLAERVDLKQSVAIKILDAAIADDPGARERFEREAKALASIESRFVVRILDYGVHEGVPFQAMAVLRGEDLHARLKRVGRLSPIQLAPIVDQVAKGLARAHALGLVHRDLKPANIFLTTEEDGEEIAKVIDFGIAKVIGQKKSDAVTQTGEIVGTPTYMSPEQIRGLREIDQRTDIWSLGATIFRALTGRIPFEGQTSGDVMVRVCTDPLPPPRSLRPNLPEEVDEFFARAMCKDVAGRYASVIDLADGFQMVAKAAVMRDEPTPHSSSLLSAPRSVTSQASARTPMSTSSRSHFERIPMVQSVAPPDTAEPKRDGPRFTTFALYGLLVGALVGVLYFGLRARTRASTAAPGPISIRASVADCVDPDAPDPDKCEREVGAGLMTMDTDFENTGTRRFVYLRFDLDAALQGKSIERATLRMTVPSIPRADGPHAGMLWQVGPFDRNDLHTRVPSPVGGFALVEQPGPAAQGAVIDFTLPVRLIHYPDSVYLSLMPQSQDGVDYFNVNNPSAPVLIIEFR